MPCGCSRPVKPWERDEAAGGGCRIVLGIWRDRKKRGLRLLYLIFLLPSAGSPRLGRRGSLSQDHEVGSELPETPLSQSLLQLIEQPWILKQLSILLLLWEDAGGNSTVKIEKGLANTDS